MIEATPTSLNHSLPPDNEAWWEWFEELTEMACRNRGQVFRREYAQPGIDAADG